MKGKITLDGAPMRGVGLRLLRASDGDELSTGFTDAKGNYVMKEVIPVKAYLEVLDSGRDTKTHKFQAFDNLVTYSGNTTRLPESKTFALSAATTTTINVKVVEGATVRGRVVDTKGRPIAKADVSAVSTTRTGWASTRTDANGRYSLRGLPTGPVEVWASKSKKYSRSTTVDAVQGRSVSAKKITLPRYAEGRFTATVKGLKKNDDVWAYDVSGKNYSVPLGVATSSTLKVNVKLGAGKYRLVVAGTNAASKTFTVKAGKTTKVGTYKAPAKSSRVKGTVKGPDGKRIKKASVVIVDKYGFLSFETLTSSKGKFSIPVGSGAYQVTVWQSSSEIAGSRKKVTVRPEKSATVNFKLSKACTVKGTVKAGGKPVEGVWIYSEAGAGETSPKGRFSIHGFGKGTTRLTVEDPYEGGYLTLRKSLKVTGSTTWNPKLTR